MKFYRIAYFICIVLLLTATLSIFVSASYSGMCGERLTWTLDDEGTLTISGTGDMNSDSPWYYYDFERVVINNGVTSIGDYSFMECTSLASVVIPDSVTSIGGYAFSGCTSLASVVIPDSVTSIGEYAFAWCDSLASVVIPDSVTSIEWFAFTWCDSLVSITVDRNNKKFSSDEYGVLYNKDKTALIQYPVGNDISSFEIPRGVTIIGAYAFNFCTSLASVVIPDSVTNIDIDAFIGCTSLASVVIPDSVTSIGEYAFSWCNSLASVVIPDSVTSIDDDVFYDCTSLTDVYYTGSKADWQKIPIDSGNECLLNATIHFNYSKPEVKPTLPKPTFYSTPVLKSNHTFKVVDSKGNPVSGATITWTDADKTISEKTDSLGNATFKLFSLASDPLVLVYKDGYITWTSAENIVNFKATNYTTIKLLPDKMSNLALISATISESGSVVEIQQDVLNKWKQIPLSKDNFTEADTRFYLNCSVRSPADAKYYQVWQDRTAITTKSENNLFELHTGDFSEGGKCFVRVFSDSNTYLDTPICIQFINPPDPPTDSFEIPTGKNVEITIPEDVPFVGGDKIDLSIPIKVPVTTKISESVVSIGFNVDLNSEKKEDKEAIKKLKEFCKTTDKVLNTDITEINKIKSVAKNSDKKKLISGFKDIEYTVVGYGEHNFSSQIATGKLFLIIDVPVFEFQKTIVYYVPLTFRFSTDFSVQTGAEFEWNMSENEFDMELFFDPSISLSAFGGVGVSKYVGVGVYGDATLGISATIIGSPCGIEEVKLDGEFGFEAYVGWLKYSKSWAKGALFEYRNPKFNESNAILASDVEKFEIDLYNAENYKLQDFSYLNDESDWLGNEAYASLMAVEAKTEFKSLLEGTYRNAQPVMVSDGNNLYAAFLRADESENVYLAVTKFDGECWSKPVKVNENAIFDSTPSLVVDDNGRIWLAYSSLSTEIDKTSLTEFALANEIVVGSIDPDTLAFAPAMTYSADNYLHSPELANLNGVPYLVYVVSEIIDDNSVLLPENSTFFAVDLTDESFEEYSVGTVNLPMYQYVPGAVDGEFAIAYTTTDGDSTNIYYLAHGDSALLAENATGSLCFDAIPGTNEYAFIWNVENGLQTSNGDFVEALGMTAEYSLEKDSIFYSKATGNSANLVVIKYDNKNFSSPIQLTDEIRYFENISTGSIDGVEYIMGMHTLTDITEENVIANKNLVWTRVTPVSDVRIDDVSYDPDKIVANEEMLMTIQASNIGDHEITSLDIYIDGELVTTKECSVLPGTSEEFEISIICPELLTEYNVLINETNNDDYNPQNNECVVSIGYADLVIETEEIIFDGSRQIISYISNIGVESASGTLKLSNTDGTLIDSIEFDDIESGNMQVITSTFDIKYFEDYDAEILVTVLTDTEEQYTYNNFETIYLSKTPSSLSIPGDANNDGKIGLSDVLVIKQYIAGFEDAINMIDLRASDVNDDGNVNDDDVILLAKYCVGWDVKLQ